eukprot:gene24379-biopygen8937
MACRGDHFWSIFGGFLQASWPPKLDRGCLKDAPQRRGYTGDILVPTVTATPGWLHMVATRNYIWVYFGYIWVAEHSRCQKTTKIASKHAPQRRVYARSVQKDPIDGTHGCAQKMVFPVASGEAVRPSARPKDAFGGEWHAEEVIFEPFWSILKHFRGQKATKMHLSVAGLTAVPVQTKNTIFVHTHVYHRWCPLSASGVLTIHGERDSRPNVVTVVPHSWTPQIPQMRENCILAEGVRGGVRRPALDSQRGVPWVYSGDNPSDACFVQSVKKDMLTAVPKIHVLVGTVWTQARVSFTMGAI